MVAVLMKKFSSSLSLSVTSKKMAPSVSLSSICLLNFVKQAVVLGCSVTDLPSSSPTVAKPFESVVIDSPDWNLAFFLTNLFFPLESITLTEPSTRRSLIDVAVYLVFAKITHPTTVATTTTAMAARMIILFLRGK